MNKCSPNRIDKIDQGCFIEKELNVIANVFKFDPKKDVYKQLQDCDNCDLNDKFTLKQLKDVLGYSIHKHIFKPSIHKNRFEWLSTSDIDIIMDQYMNFDNSFKYLGTFPSDILSVGYKLPKVKYYKKLALVLNLDPHNLSGSHWVSVYIDILECKVEYFDSLGDKPTRNIKKVLGYLCKELDCDLSINSQQFQIEDSECGIYSLYYIISRLLGIKSSNIIKNVIRDTKMNKYRDILYSSKKN
jgi:hypothetical protein